MAFEKRQPVTEIKFINKSSLFILLLGVIRRLERKPIKKQKLRIYSSPRHIAKRHCVSSEAVCEMRAGPSMGGAEQPPPSNRLHAALFKGAEW